MLTQDRLKELVVYSHETGFFTWKSFGKYSKREGKRAGSVCGSKRIGVAYEKMMVDHKRYFSHRLAWLYFYGEWPKNQIDHIDGDTLNNKINNLRDVTTSENHKNRSVDARNKSGYPGVYYWYGKWLVNISIDKKRVHLGVFNNVDDAIKCRKKAEIEHDYHKNHGRPKMVK